MVEKKRITRGPLPTDMKYLPTIEQRKRQLKEAIRQAVVFIEGRSRLRKETILARLNKELDA